MDTERIRPARVLIVEDQPLMRLGIAKLIGGAPDIHICGEAENATQALQKLEELKPNLVTVDISLPGSRNGLELIKDIKARQPDLPMLVLSAHEDEIYADRALQAGASGYVNKGEMPERLLSAIRCVLGGEYFLSPTVATRLLKRRMGGPEEVASPLQLLTDTELEVFNLIGQGLGTRQIADQLHRSVKTIEAHKTALKKKLELKNANELFHYAVVSTISKGGRPLVQGTDPHLRSAPPDAPGGYWLVSPLLADPHRLTAGERRTIGRVKAQVDVHINSDLVSREHAEIRWDEEYPMVLDLGSKNGTFVNGFKLRDSVYLHPHDRLSFGGLDLELQVVQSTVSPSETPESTRGTRGYE